MPIKCSDDAMVTAVFIKSKSTSSFPMVTTHMELAKRYRDWVKDFSPTATVKLISYLGHFDSWKTTTLNDALRSIGVPQFSSRLWDAYNSVSAETVWSHTPDLSGKELGHRIMMDRASAIQQFVYNKLDLIL